MRVTLRGQVASCVFKCTVQDVDAVLQFVEFLPGYHELILGQGQFLGTLSHDPVPLTATLPTELPWTSATLAWCQHVPAPPAAALVLRLFLPLGDSFCHDENVGGSTVRLVDLPVAPSRSFASDNFSPAHPRYLDAIARANTGHVRAYGDDEVSARAVELFRGLCGLDVEVLFTFGGTGANVVALSSLLRPAESVICTSWSHINVDETGAPEKFLGAKLQDVPADDAKLRPEHIEQAAAALGNVHHVQPGVVSITQATELGGFYEADEITQLCDVAHSHGMRVHLDGARIANAVAALGGDVTTFRELTFGAGVDAVSFGGTKNGMLGAEAVLFRPGVTNGRERFLRKQATQLPSKARYIAAQFVEALEDGLWLNTAAQANLAAARLYDSLKDVDRLALSPPKVNSLYPIVPSPHKETLQDWCFFWDWDLARSQVRWMTSWDTTDEDVARFAEGVRLVLAQP